MKHPIIRIVGIYQIEAEESVWLIEAEVSGEFAEIDWGSITQPTDQDASNWQVPYDERDLGKSGAGKRVAAFFFHYLQLDLPLESAYGPLALPRPTLLPERLRFIEYESP